MKREASPPRPDFAAEAASLGFEFAFADGEPYWDERVRYVFTRGEIEGHLETAAADLHALCLELVGRVVESDALLTRLRIPRRSYSLWPFRFRLRWQWAAKTARMQRGHADESLSRRQSCSGDGSNNWA